MEREYIAEWLRFADMDLASAEHLANTMLPKPLEYALQIRDFE